jgi:glycosyltransferase involved in cell wall biosynthesis
VALDPAETGKRLMSSPTAVSVVVPVHNGERYLHAAITSLLEQTDAPSEIIVVDDGSTDASAEVAHRFGAPVRLLRTAHGGIGAARNAGLRATTGGMLGFLDADDLWTPHALSHLRTKLAAAPELDLVFGRVRHFASAELDPAEAARLLVREGLEPAYLAGGGLIRRHALDRIGSFREDLQTGEFVDLMARAREAGLREGLIDQQVLWRRVHLGNHGHSHASRVDYAQVLKSALDRRRAASTGPEIRG